MLSPDRLLRMIIEVLFMVLGGLVVWLGVTRHIFFDRRSLGWLAVSVILVIWGARDAYVVRETAQQSVRMCDVGELVFFEEATHWVQHDEPERVNRLLLDFLRIVH